jgi:prepilin-type N-terminal cleavage/methylation domain-containing protein
MQKGFIMKIKAANKALRQQAGYTLIELSISVAIIAVLVLTGLYGVPRILDTNKVTTASQQITLATANYSKLASTSTDKTWATTGVAYVPATALPLAGMGVWPEESVLKSTAVPPIAYGLKHTFGGFIYSRNTTAGLLGYLGTDEGYLLKLEKVPAKNCFDMASAFGNTALQIGVDSSAAPTAGPITVEPPANTVNVKAAGSALNNTELAKQCQTNATAAKTIYLWFQY